MKHIHIFRLKIRNLGNEKYCLDALDIDKAELKTYVCHGLGGNQYWEMTVLSSNLVQIKRDSYSFTRDSEKLILKSGMFSTREQVRNSETLMRNFFKDSFNFRTGSTLKTPNKFSTLPLVCA